MVENEEFNDILRRAQAGDAAAKEYLLEHNLNLVRSIVRRFLNRGHEWDDLFQIGCIGLIKAIDRFDTSFNAKFSTYAVPLIIGEIRRFLRDDSPLKVSRPLKELALKVNQMQEKLQGQLGRDPTITEVAKMLALAPEEIVAALEATQPPASLYDRSYYNDGDSVSRIERINPNTGQEDSCIDKLALKEVLARLPSRERLIVHLRFFEDKTQTQVAEVLGLSQVQVSRLEKQALKMIREYLQTS